MNTSKHFVALMFILCLRVKNIHGKLKILALIPYDGKSHFYFAEVIFEELARRGHDITVLSHFPRKTPMPNYHDISIATKESVGIHSIDMERASANFQVLDIMEFFNIGLERVCREGLSHPNVQKLLKSKERYDLLITEMFNADCFLGFVAKFGAPFVALRTSALSTWLSDRTGNPDHPAYIPGTTSGYPSRMNFLQRLNNVIYYVTYKSIYWMYNRWCEQVARQHFGEDMPSLQDIARNTSLYLVDAHFVHQYAKPLVPSVKEVAGLHVRKPKPLKEDLENWIRGAKQGLIYLNLGSMIKPASIAEDKKRAFLDSFAQLPHRVLMKWDVDGEIPGQSDNVRLTTWAPQNDVLHHPNVKLFITHGGMLGSVEAVHAGVPMVIIPFFGDQLTNSILLQERGLGIVLNYKDITFSTLSQTLSKVLYDPKYTKRAKQLSEAFRDRPIPALEEAVYWIEYVARHKGPGGAEDLMRSSALELPLHQYLLIDVLVVLLLGLAVILLTLRVFAKLLLGLVFRRSGSETDLRKKKN